MFLNGLEPLKFSLNQGYIKFPIPGGGGYQIYGEDYQVGKKSKFEKGGGGRGCKGLGKHFPSFSSLISN